MVAAKRDVTRVARLNGGVSLVCEGSHGQTWAFSVMQHEVTDSSWEIRSYDGFHPLEASDITLSEAVRRIYREYTARSITIA